MPEADDLMNPVHTPSDSLIYELPSIVECLRPTELFTRVQPTEIEAGCGDGSFLVNYAIQHPDRNFIGTERLLGRIRKLDRKGRRAGLRNVRGVRIESAYFLQYLLPPGLADALHVYFPDPWPKRKHRRHRLINEGFPALAARVLRRGGRVYLRTDDPSYYDQMLEVFRLHAGFELVETPTELSELQTDFELEFRAKGIPTLRAAYARVEG